MVTESSHARADASQFSAHPKVFRRLPRPRNVASLECSARSPKDPPDELRRHPHSRRPTAQPEEPRPRHPHRRDDGRDRAERIGQVEPRLRHALRRRAAALRRDLQRLRAPVPRAHGPARGRQGRGRAAGDRDRPDQPGAQLALDGRDDDRAQRPPEAAVRARRRAVRQGNGAARAPRFARDDLRRPDAAHGARRRRATSRA